MGLGPIPASRRALERAGLSVDDLDLVELNEVAAQAVPVIESLARMWRTSTSTAEPLPSVIRWEPQAHA